MYEAPTRAGLTGNVIKKCTGGVAPFRSPRRCSVREGLPPSVAPSFLRISRSRLQSLTASVQTSHAPDFSHSQPPFSASDAPDFSHSQPAAARGSAWISPKVLDMLHFWRGSVRISMDHSLRRRISGPFETRRCRYIILYQELERRFRKKIFRARISPRLAPGAPQRGPLGF